MRNIENNEDEFNEKTPFPRNAGKGRIKTESLPSNDMDNEDVQKRRAEQREAIAKITRELARKYPDNMSGGNLRSASSQGSASSGGTAGAKKPDYPLNTEKALLTALRKGEPDEVKKLLHELAAMIVFFNSGDFKAVQLSVIELVVQLSRIEAAPGNSDIFAMEAKNQSLRQAMEAQTVEDLTDILLAATERVSNFIAAFRGSPHAAALRRAENFIAQNYTRKLSLKEIAGVAGLSPPYFSTIFKEEMGENLSKYLNRLRVEKASALLLQTDMTLSEIAACCCFEDQSWFSKIFKAFTGISPGKYRNQGGGVISDLVDSNLSQAFRKAMQKKAEL